MVMEVVVIIIGLLLTIAIVALAISQVLPAVAAAVERVRIEREAAEASWQIHVQAAHAFDELLKVRREQEQNGSDDR